MSLYDCHIPISLVHPDFDERVDPYLTATKSIKTISSTFNHYFDVEDFFHLRSDL